MIPKLVGHRGYMGKYPENSLMGIKAALEAGACMVEFDVQMNADHNFVVLHDSDFQRTAGLDRSVFNLKSSEIAGISVHQPEKFGGTFSKTPLPTLTQVLDLVADYPQSTAFVEIKVASIKKWGLEFVMKELLVSLQPYKSQCVVISFSFDAVVYVKQHGLFRTGWVLEGFDEVSHKKADNLKPDYLICNQTKISDDIGLWQGDWLWVLYDIIDPEVALQWALRGVALIETCDIGGMLRHIELGKESC